MDENIEKTIQQMTQEIAEKAHRNYLESVDTYILRYLADTGLTIKDVVMMHGTTWKEGTMYASIYLRPKTVEERNAEGLGI